MAAGSNKKAALRLPVVLEFCLAQADFFDIFTEELAQVVQAQRHERHAVDTDTPCKHRNIDAHCLGHFRAEYAGAAKLEPAELGVLDVDFDGRFREGEVGTTAKR